MSAVALLYLGPVTYRVIVENDEWVAYAKDWVGRWFRVASSTDWFELLVLLEAHQVIEGIREEQA
jgi:hypothetical protein